ncbi:MAG: MTAP family purine nucleoside phosphorylase [Candidatus Thermoplasmatota archaeon]|nr:MTAP family purine nucleoside phosphorylase [Candidatus Thermoplasmatota archaeon]MDD5777974.1 MTAP family purine nucleoside phosphorylase [Candidatus Thermoplasmatota archaeon]
MRIGIIGGTGIYGYEGNTVSVDTAYGEVEVVHAVQGDHAVFFVPRHGAGHVLPPHRVNHRANLQALADCHVDRVIGITTVGSLREDITPGMLFVPGDFIDFTVSRPTFFDRGAVHVDMSQPFCPEVREAVLAAARSRQGEVAEGVYACTSGPRLETPAEVALLQQFAHVVGMTLAPEATLARERGLCYASLSLVSNLAAGLQKALPAQEIAAIYDRMRPVVMAVLREVVCSLPEERSCGCRGAAERGQL